MQPVRLERAQVRLNALAARQTAAGLHGSATRTAALGTGLGFLGGNLIAGADNVRTTLRGRADLLMNEAADRMRQREFKFNARAAEHSIANATTVRQPSQPPSRHSRFSTAIKLMNKPSGSHTLAWLR